MVNSNINSDVWVDPFALEQAWIDSLDLAEFLQPRHVRFDDASLVVEFLSNWRMPDLPSRFSPFRSGPSYLDALKHQANPWPVELHSFATQAISPFEDWGFREPKFTIVTAKGETVILDNDSRWNRFWRRGRAVATPTLLMCKVAIDSNIFRSQSWPRNRIFWRALLTLFELRIIFGISPSAIAAMLRFLQSVASGTNPGRNSTRYSESSVLTLRSENRIYVLCEGACPATAGTTASTENGCELAVLIILDVGFEPFEETNYPPLNLTTFQLTAPTDTITTDHNQDPGHASIQRRKFSGKSCHMYAWTFYVANMWLERHCRLRTDVPRQLKLWNQDTPSDFSQRLVDLKSAKLNIKRLLFPFGFSDVLNSSSAAAHDAVNSYTSSLETRFEHDYTEALEEAAILHEALQIRTTSLQMQDARQSLRETHSVSRITELAFIFLPLTFITGVFGMNLKPFSAPNDQQQRDGAPMWQFWTTLVVILVPVWGFGLMALWDDINSKGASLIREYEVANRSFRRVTSVKPSWVFEMVFILIILGLGKLCRYLVGLTVAFVDYMARLLNVSVKVYWSQPGLIARFSARSKERPPDVLRSVEDQNEDLAGSTSSRVSDSTNEGWRSMGTVAGRSRLQSAYVSVQPVRVIQGSREANPIQIVAQEMTRGGNVTRRTSMGANREQAVRTVGEEIAGLGITSRADELAEFRRFSANLQMPSLSG